MPALQVKDFPADLYESLRACAAEDDRSISQQTTHVLREYLQARGQMGNRIGWAVVPTMQEASVKRAQAVTKEHEARVERRQKVFEEIDALPTFEVPDDFPEPAELVRQMREERDDCIVPVLGRTQ